jgi:DNA repair exonuclease SbcCD ATPase subunit
MSGQQTADQTPALVRGSNDVLRALEEMKEQFGQSMRLDLRAEDLRNVVEEAVKSRMPPLSPNIVVDDAALAKSVEKDARIADLEERLRRAEATAEEEIRNRRRIEELAMNKAAAEEAKIADLEDRWSRADAATEEEVKIRRAAEDRLAEVQRLLRISSEEEDRLRDAVDEREVKIRQIVDQSDAKVRAAEESRAKAMMKITLLEASQDNAQRSNTEYTNRMALIEGELREARKEILRWQMDAERALEAAKRHSEDAEQANETNKGLRRTIDSLRTQMEESVRIREGMRGKLMGLQEDMALAAREISEDNTRHAKKEQELIARQEVLDAKLQAEARTRERLELEIERLEKGEREGMRAVSECKRLEALVTELKNESHAAQKDAMRYQREFEEARESGLSEVQRTRHYLQAQVESANNQVNVVREDLENQLSRLRAELDQVKLESDTAREKHEMLLEEANLSKKVLLDELNVRHTNEMEDLQTQHERQLNNAIEDAQRQEQHLLERLAVSSAKTEHLQDRVSHLEDKLDLAKCAASAAVKAARSASTSSTYPTSPPATVTRAMELPEKISPQALRESIMVLQEQLQDREKTIEKLEQQVASLDPDSGVKISKRDDEILWLRELLAVRKSDLEDVINTLETEDYDPEQVKDAAIRLRANLQMEEQERERAMNGGSALNLPNIAATLRDVATPRVAQAVGPLAAAWGNWRKGRENSVSVSGRGSSATPSKKIPAPQNFLSGLMTPPASNLRRSPHGGGNEEPTAFANTGTRFTAQQLANRSRTLTPRAREKQTIRGNPRNSTIGGQPETPPKMRKSSYDNDARAEDFSDAGFYDDDESPVDNGMFGIS